jgi:hypothetical protein
VDEGGGGRLCLRHWHWQEQTQGTCRMPSLCVVVHADARGGAPARRALGSSCARESSARVVGSVSASSSKTAEPRTNPILLLLLLLNVLCRCRYLPAYGYSPIKGCRLC